MIDGLPLTYTLARCAARAAQRADERLWQQLEAARTLPALLDVARGSRIAPWISGVGPRAGIDTIDHALRQQARTAIEDVARWSPAHWRAAVLWCRTLLDLPALIGLMRPSPAPAWIADDPQLARWVAGRAAQSLPARLALLEEESARSGPLAPLAGALREAAAPDATGVTAPIALLQALRAQRPTAQAGLHPVLRAWLAHWRSLCPDSDSATRTALDALVRLVGAHLVAFGRQPPALAAAARAGLASRVRALLRTGDGGAAALFGALLFTLLDLERLRAACLLRAASELHEAA